LTPQTAKKEKRSKPYALYIGFLNIEELVEKYIFFFAEISSKILHTRVWQQDPHSCTPVFPHMVPFIHFVF
jgi:hypothetical protein